MAGVGEEVTIDPINAWVLHAAETFKVDRYQNYKVCMSHLGLVVLFLTKGGAKRVSCYLLLILERSQVEEKASLK